MQLLPNCPMIPWWQELASGGKDGSIFPFVQHKSPQALWAVFLRILQLIIIWLFIAVSLVRSPVVEGQVSTYAFCELAEKRETLKNFLGITY